MRYVVVFLSFVALNSPLQARSPVFEDGAIRAMVQRVVGNTFVMQYLQALSTADSLELSLPGHPAAPLLKTGVLYCRMLDFEDLADLTEFNQSYDIAWKRTEILAENLSAEKNLYFGVLLGFKALLHQRQGRWWPAVKLGMKSVRYLEVCLKTDSTFADALLGVGTYKYWRSRATDFINWLPIFSDEKKAGIAMVREAMDEGLISREIARSTLAWILIDNNHPSEAISLSLEGLKSYPDSRFYLWTLADGYLHGGQYRKAIPVFQKLYDSLHPLERNNGYNEVGLCKQMTRCYQQLQDPRSALEWVERGLAVSLDEDAGERRKKDIARFKALREDLLKQLAGQTK